MKHILKRQVLILAAIFLLNISNAQTAQAASKKSGVYTLYRNGTTEFVRAQAPSKESGVYTLYRNGTEFVKDRWIANPRIHIATFDSKERGYGMTNAEFNKLNCTLGTLLFMSQPEGTSTFWCEKGYYKE